MQRGIHVLRCLLSMIVSLSFVLGPLCIGVGFYFDSQFNRNPLFALLIGLTLALPFDKAIVEYYSRKADLSYENVDEYVEKILERTTGYYLSPAKVYEYDRNNYKKKLIAIIEQRG